MFFINREYGKLIKKDNINGSIVYTVENSKGKTQTISFDNDVCPAANVGDEVFYIYNRNISSNIKKGINLSDNLKEISVLSYNLFDDFIIAFKEVITYVTLSLVLMHTIINLTSQFILFALKYMNVSHINILSLCLILIIAITPGISSGAWLCYRFGKSLGKFRHLLIKKDKYFHPYKKENFTKKDILFNKKINDEEKRELNTFVRNIEGLSSTEKLEIHAYIEEKKKMKVSHIEYLDILSLTNKLKMKKQVEQLLLK